MVRVHDLHFSHCICLTHDYIVCHKSHFSLTNSDTVSGALAETAVSVFNALFCGNPECESTAATEQFLASAASENDLTILARIRQWISVILGNRTWLRWARKQDGRAKEMVASLWMSVDRVVSTHWLHDPENSLLLVVPLRVHAARTYIRLSSRGRRSLDLVLGLLAVFFLGSLLFRHTLALIARLRSCQFSISMSDTITDRSYSIAWQGLTGRAHPSLPSPASSAGRPATSRPPSPSSPLMITLKIVCSAPTLSSHTFDSS